MEKFKHREWKYQTTIPSLIFPVNIPDHPPIVTPQQVMFMRDDKRHVRESLTLTPERAYELGLLAVGTIPFVQVNVQDFIDGKVGLDGKAINS